MARSWWWLIVAGILLVGGAFAFWLLLLEPIHSHDQWFRRVRAHIVALADKRPLEVSPGQWEFAVGWTINLHANCGAAHTWVNRVEAGPFAEELERRSQGPVSLATIDWIWDEYVRMTEGGQSYSDKYRPTRSPDRELAQPGCFGIRVK
jgi:hypothetical protein